MQKQGVVTGCNLGGSGTDPAANLGLVQNLLSQEAEALHLLLINEHFLLPALFKDGSFVITYIYMIVQQPGVFDKLFPTFISCS